MSTPEPATARLRQSGFDIILGNPPWERVKLQEQEFFAQRDPAIAGARNAAARKTAIAALTDTNPALLAEFQEATRRAEGESHLMRSSGRYPLCGRGDINTYAVFAESMRDGLSPAGRLGVIVPTGIATDDTTKFFFGDLVQSHTLRVLYDFENQGIFEDVHSSYKFCILAVAGSASPADARIEFSFFAHSVEEAVGPGRRFSMSPSDITLLNPNTRTCPVFRSERDAEITKAIYRRVPVLIREACGDEPEVNPWGLTFLRMLDMANDSGKFRTRNDLEAEGWTLVGNHFRRDKEVLLPLYEAKMTSLYDHRHGNVVGSDDLASLSGIPAVATTEEQHRDPAFCAMPRYWVPEAEVRAVVDRTGWPYRYFIAFRDLARSTDARTAIHSVVPWAAVNHKTPIMLPLGVEPRWHAALLANLNSFVYDYALRQKIGGASVSFFIVKQTPVLPPEAFDEPCRWDSGTATLLNWIVPRVLELVYTSDDLSPFAEALSWDGRPFVWDAERRFQIRCELDAAMFHAYGVQRADVDHILDTFPVCKRYDMERYSGLYRTKQRVLAIFDEMAEAIRTTASPPLPTAAAAPAFLPPTRAQVAHGRAAAYITLLAATWAKPIERQAIEYALVLMLNDALRAKVLAQPGAGNGGRHRRAPQPAATASHAASAPATQYVQGLDAMLGSLQANQVLKLATVGGEGGLGMQRVELGTRGLAMIQSLPEADRTRATEAVAAFEILKANLLRMESFAAVTDLEFSVV